MDKVILTPIDVEVTQHGISGTWTIRTWEARYDWVPARSSENLRWLRGHGVTQEEAVASLHHDRYVEEGDD